MTENSLMFKPQLAVEVRQGIYEENWKGDSGIGIQNFVEPQNLHTVVRLPRNNHAIYSNETTNGYNNRFATLLDEETTFFGNRKFVAPAKRIMRAMAKEAGYFGRYLTKDDEPAMSQRQIKYLWTIIRAFNLNEDNNPYLRQIVFVYAKMMM